MYAQDIIKFWFETIEPKLWWVKDDSFDELLRKNYLGIHHKASKGELSNWRKTPLGRLAEIIILDQFSRNMFRDTPEAFAYDGMALVLAQEAITVQTHTKLNDKEKSFLYMPFMHSESIEIHQIAMKLFAEPGLEGNIDFEKRHMEIIKRFGRYPHRNNILGRESTAEELEFLKQPGSSF